MSDTTGDLLQADTVVAHRYRVRGYLRDRGFGQVYEAEDSAMEGHVALMRLDREFSHPRVRESFFETRATAQVNDPRIVDFIDYGEDVDGRLFLVMPWIDDARGLDEHVSAEKALPWPRIRAITEQIAGALEAAHGKGVLHGGLEPSRVLIDSADGIHVVDFGLAPALTRPGGRPVTNVSPLPGNTAYLSPEQIRGEPVDARSDIYALGVILWELVSGAPPFAGDSVAVANAHLDRPLPELLRRGAPPELEALLHLALAKDKNDRLADAGEFLALLQAMPGEGAERGRPAVSRTPTKVLAPGAAGPARKSRTHAAAPARKSRTPAAPPPRTSAAPARKSRTPAAPPPRTSRPPAQSAQPRATTPPPPTSRPPAQSAQPPATTPPPPTSRPTAQPAQSPATAQPPPPPPEPTPSAAPPHEDHSAIPQPIGVPTTSEATPSPTVPPPRKKRRLGKLELAIILFVGFDVLLFAAWKLFLDAPGDGQEVAASEEPPPPASPAAEDQKPEPEPEPADPEPEPEPADSEPAPNRPTSVHEAIASELPPEPDSPGPMRPMDQSLNDKDFREAMVAARDDIVERCLDTRMRRTLKVSLKVAPNGEVEYARVLGDLADTQLGRCVIRRVYRIEFPATHSGGTHIYTLRLR